MLSLPAWRAGDFLPPVGGAKCGSKTHRSVHCFNNNNNNITTTIRRRREGVEEIEQEEEEEEL